MSNRTVAAHLDHDALVAFKDLVKTENRNPSQVIGVALRSLLDYSPNARRALFAIDGIADATERAFAARLIGRAVLRAYEGILEARHESGGASVGETLPDEDAIEAEAVRLCAR